MAEHSAGYEIRPRDDGDYTIFFDGEEKAFGPLQCVELILRNIRKQAGQAA